MLKTGTVLAGRYEIVGKIGSGGMADVYKAKDRTLNRFVATKVMKPEFQGDDTFISKFRSEAQAAAGLAHPNIVNVYDVGEDEGNYYIVMELVEGITLKEYIAKKGKLTVREATSIAIQVCMGLAAAHDQNIVHRDVKPQNICISTDGKVKVTDFGIARAASSNTISANAMGSVHYSSPEQVRGGYSDARSDIYSLGITLYEMVTGHVPFDGDSTVSIAIKHLQDEIEPPTKYTPNLPYALEQIIYKCTQKSVDRRYQSMNEMIVDLKRSLIEPDGHFVDLAPLADNSATRTITAEESEAIRAGKVQGVRTDTGSAKTYSSIDAARNGDEDYYSDSQDGESASDDGEVSTGLEKAVTIGSFIVCGLIICVLVFFIARAAGLFRTQSVATTGDQTVESEAAQSGLIAVPGIEGMTEAQAQTAAAARGLNIQYQGEEHSDRAEGTVLRQDPAADALVEAGSTIYYYKSSGPVTYAIPAVAGQYVTDAEDTLKAAGFTSVKVVKEYSSEVTVGNVISVTPAEGERITAGTVVTLSISGGPEGASDIYVTDYTGTPIDDVVSDAKYSGFIVRIQYGTSSNVGTDQVMSQTPSGGQSVAYGTDLLLVVNNAEKQAAALAAESAAAEALAEPSETPTPTAEPTSAPTVTSEPGTVSTQASTPSVTDDGSIWTASGILQTPPSYDGGAYRLILTQNVGGSEVQTVIEENTTALEFPYTLIINGASGVAEGTVWLYEEVSAGNYTAKAYWPVTFQKAA